MSHEFGWWDKDPDGRKFQVWVRVFGGNITWTRKQGHHQPWMPFAPGDADWDLLLAEAERRVPRRLLSPKQFDALKRLRPH